MSSRLPRSSSSGPRAEGVELVGPEGMLTGLTKNVLETALDAEMSEHLGYDKHDPAGRDGANFRNGVRTKTPHRQRARTTGSCSYWKHRGSANASGTPQPTPPTHQ